jgi:hypothetical protein
MSQCEYCGATPANYWITEEDGQRIALCAECRADVDYCERGGKPEPEAGESQDEVDPDAVSLWDTIIDSRIRQLKGKEG